MKNGQVVKSKFHRGQGIIQRLGPSMVEIKWFTESDGSPLTHGDNMSTHKREDIQHNIDSGSLTVYEPTDPNILFLMRKHNVRS